MADQLQLPQDPVFGMQPSFLAQKAPRQAPAAPSAPGIEQPTGATRLQTLYQGVQSAQKKVEESSKARDEIAQGEALLNTEKEAQQARIQADNLRQQQEAIQPLAEQLSEKQQEAAARFEPTQDTVKDLAGLFGLIGIVGVGLGRGPKGNAMQAMAAMNGMMEGYRQGRMDLYEKEKSRFETNLKSLHRDIQSIHERMADIVKLSATNRDQALQDLNVLFAEKQLDFLKQQTEKFGLARGLAHAESMLKSAEKAVESFEREERRVQEKMRAEEARLQASKELAQVRESLRAGRPVGAGKAAAPIRIIGPNNEETMIRPTYDESGVLVLPEGFKLAAKQAGALLSGRAENIREAFVQAAKDIRNITLLPPNTMLGGLAGLTGKSGDDFTSSLRNTLARKVTSDEQRMMQVMIGAIDQNLTFALGGGYASSQSKARMEGYSQQIAKAGDNPIIVATTLARLRQEMNVLADNFASKPGASPEMTKAVLEANDRINKAVPFTVEDVIRARFGSKAGGPAAIPKREGASEAPQKAMLNNRVIVVRGGKWVYEDDGTEAK